MRIRSIPSLTEVTECVDELEQNQCKTLFGCIIQKNRNLKSKNINYISLNRLVNNVNLPSRENRQKLVAVQMNKWEPVTEVTVRCSSMSYCGYRLGYRPTVRSRSIQTPFSSDAMHPTRHSAIRDSSLQHRDSDCGSNGTLTSNDDSESSVYPLSRINR